MVALVLAALTGNTMASFGKRAVPKPGAAAKQPA